MSIRLGVSSQFTGQLLHSMYKDRADQFRTRLGWKVSVNAKGEEKDEYDNHNCVYVMVCENNSKHLGSLRLMPTTVKNMVLDVFSDLVPADFVMTDQIWECTRFCLSPNLNHSKAKCVVFELMIGALDFGIKNGVRNALGVFDARMIRIYRQIGWCPKIIGQSLSPQGKIQLGLWDVSFEKYALVKERYALLEYNLQKIYEAENFVSSSNPKISSNISDSHTNFNSSL